MNHITNPLPDKFRAIITTEGEDGVFRSNISLRKLSDLPQHAVLIRVLFSGLNYKDALSATGHKGITRKYPHTPGIDAAGLVVKSETSDFKPGDEVIVTGYDLGMNTSGGLAEYICVPAAWIVKRPGNLTLEESMIIGTSGFTAASAVYEIYKHGINPEDGNILVSGATGAVGSAAVVMLAQAGYKVIASSGKPEEYNFLKSIGASEVIERDTLNDQSGRGLLPARWVAALDTVGGNTLSTILLSTKERGLVANCGMIASDKLQVPVFPFIIRGVRLIGIASADTPMPRRLEIWKLISEIIKPEKISLLKTTISLEEVPEVLYRMKNAATKGKMLVKISN